MVLVTRSKRVGDRWLKRGFTLVELILVLILVGIMSAIALPRFFDRADYDALGFVDQTRSLLRFAQKTAIAHRRDVWVQIDQASGYVCLTYVATDANCTNASGTSSNAVIDPLDTKWYRRVAPTGVSFAASTSFRFTALGRINPVTNISIVINGGGGATIAIDGETGYVR